MRKTVKRILMTGAALTALVLAALAFRPKPVEVETARAVMGPLQVTVDEDGETRAHDRFTLAAPVAGRLSRIEFHEGDEVGPNAVLATISPLPLDAREVAEIRARNPAPSRPQYTPTGEAEAKAFRMWSPEDNPRLSCKPTSIV